MIYVMVDTASQSSIALDVMWIEDASLMTRGAIGDRGELIARQLAMTNHKSVQRDETAVVDLNHEVEVIELRLKRLVFRKANLWKVMDTSSSTNTRQSSREPQVVDQVSFSVLKAKASASVSIPSTGCARRMEGEDLVLNFEEPLVIGQLNLLSVPKKVNSFALFTSTLRHCDVCDRNDTLILPIRIFN